MAQLRANQADQALIQYEASQDLVEMHEMTDEGDHKTFSASDSPWSDVGGYEPTIRPNGLLTGGVITPGSADDTVDVAALTCYMAGELVSVDAEDGFSVSRPTGDNAKISSITINSSGAVTEVEGAEATGTTFSSERGADGGPPWIPTDSIEIGQVRMSSSSAAAISSDEIRQVPGTHMEKSDHPIWAEDYVEGQIEFISALPTIHSDDDGSTEETKEIYCEVYTPDFASLEPASEFVPPETSHSQSSTEVYGGTIGSSSSSLNQGSFTVYLKDGVTDAFLDMKNEKIWVKFFPHRLRDPYLLAQGILGIARTFPAGDSIQAACTLTATSPAVEMES